MAIPQAARFRRTSSEHKYKRVNPAISGMAIVVPVSCRRRLNTNSSISVPPINTSPLKATPNTTIRRNNGDLVEAIETGFVAIDELYLSNCNTESITITTMV